MRDHNYARSIKPPDSTVAVSTHLLQRRKSAAIGAHALAHGLPADGQLDQTPAATTLLQRAVVAGDQQQPNEGLEGKNP